MRGWLWPLHPHGPSQRSVAGALLAAQLLQATNTNN